MVKTVEEVLENYKKSLRREVELRRRLQNAPNEQFTQGGLRMPVSDFARMTDNELHQQALFLRGAEMVLDLMSDEIRTIKTEIEAEAEAASQGGVEFTQQDFQTC